jgi:CobQ-like glutamine amidotransferase family enzyme
VVSSDLVTIALVYPTVLGLYGDRGNALVLAHRARARGLRTEMLVIDPGEAVPRHADVYLLGGGEDLAQARVVELLRDDGGVAAAIRRDAPMLAVCAGFQILGRSFPAAGGIVAGLDLVDVVTEPGQPRSVGELATIPVGLGIPMLTGYENHGGWTTLGPGVEPLGRVVHGVGNRPGAGTDGCRVGHLFGTYLHGPVLARNPALADLMLQRATGMSVLPPMDDTWVEALRAERLGTLGLR